MTYIHFNFIIIYFPVQKEFLLRGPLVNQVVGEIIAHQAEDSSLIWKDEQPQRNWNKSESYGAAVEKLGHYP